VIRACFTVRPLLPLLGLVISTCMPVASHAALIVTSVSNTPTTYMATVNWTASTDPFTIDTLGCSTGTPVLTLSCTPWMPVQLQAVQSPFFPGQGQVSLSIQHLVGPHAIDVNPGTAVAVNVLNVSPGIGSGTATANTAHTPHFDAVTLSVTAISAGLSEITITANHSEVPEPGTMALGFLGAAVLAAGRRLRRRTV
jgi:PEP-CTERM motif